MFVFSSKLSHFLATLIKLPSPILAVFYTYLSANVEPSLLGKQEPKIDFGNVNNQLTLKMLNISRI